MIDVSNFFSELLPIVGLIVLVLLMFVLIKLIKLLGSIEVTINKTHGSIGKVEETLTKIQTPVDTAVKVSLNIDKACDATVKAIDDTKEYVSKNVGAIKGKVSDALSKVSNGENKNVGEPEELKEVNLDDILNNKGE